MGDAADAYFESIEFAYHLHLIGDCDQGCGWCEDVAQAEDFTLQVLHPCCWDQCGQCIGCVEYEND